MALRFFCYTSATQAGGVGLEYDGRFIDLSQLLGSPFDQPDLTAVIQGGFFSLEELEDVEELVKRRGEKAAMPKDWRWSLPVRRPDKVLAMARNYQAHAEEFKAQVPEEPIFFAKLAQSLTPHDAPVVIPAWLSTRVDHEVELAVIIGTTAKNVLPERALDHVAGYSILNDVTARDLQTQDIQNRRPWVRSKSLDTFGPFGPFVVPKAYVPNPHELDITLKVNGQVRQSSNTAKMIFKIPAVIAAISRYTTLQPGDVIAMGTPEGVGPVGHGDVMEATIPGLGTLKNAVRAEVS
ncbi:MAG: fumarylacetoacetate hydrolase family protein [Planctomycetota bacterium]